MKELSFMAAMKDFFGLALDQKLSEFAAECKALSDEDRAYFIAGLEGTGDYKIKEATLTN